MSIYSDACFELAMKCIAGRSTFGMAYSDYICGIELHELAVSERNRFDPEHPGCYGGSQKAWDERVWRIAKGAWKDAMVAAGRPGRMEVEQ